MLEKIINLQRKYYVQLIYVYLVLLIISIIGTYKFFGQITSDLHYLLPSKNQLIQDTREYNRRFLHSENSLIILETNAGASINASETLKNKIEKNEKLKARIVKNNFKDEIAYFKQNEVYFYPVENFIGLASELNSIDKNANKKSASEYKGLLKNYLVLKEKRIFRDLFALPSGHLSSHRDDKSMVLIIHNEPVDDLENAQVFMMELNQILDDLKNNGDIENYSVNSYAKNLVDDYESLWSDLYTSSFLIILLLAIILYVFIRSAKIIFFINLPVVLGILATYSLVSFIFDKTNSNSYFLSTMIVGNSVNVGIIFLANWYNEIVENNSVRNLQVNNVIRNSIKPTFFAMISSLVIYASLLIFDFRGYYDLGVIGIIGMLLCWISYVIFLPVFMYTGLISDSEIKKIKLNTFFNNFKGFNLSWKYAYLVAVVFLVIGLKFSFFHYDNIFEKDLTNIRSSNYVNNSYQSFSNNLVGIAVNKELLPVASILFQNNDDLIQFRKRLHGSKQLFDLAPELRSYAYEDIYPNDLNVKNSLISNIKNQPKIDELIESPDVGREKENFIKLIKNHEKILNYKEEVPLFFNTIFSSNDKDKIGDIVYLSFDLNRLEKKSDEMVKFISKIDELKNKSKSHSLFVGVIPLMVEIFKEIEQKWKVSLAISFVFVLLTIYLSNRNFKIFIKLVGIYLCLIISYIFFLNVFNLKINVLSFLSLLLTVGIGVDYSLNLITGHSNKINLVPFVILNCLITLVSYLGLYLGTSHLALSSFGLLSMLGEVLAITIALAVTRSVALSKK